MKTKTKADLMLLLITVFWGFSYLLADLSLAELPVFQLNALRFLIAFLIAGISFGKKLFPVTIQTVKASFLLSLILTGVYTSATFGLKFTSLSNASFLSSLSVLFTPIILWILFHREPSRRIVTSVLLSVVGIALLTIQGDFIPAWGDLLCIICAMIYGLHLVTTEFMVRKPEVDAFQTGVYQLGFTGLLNLILSMIIEKQVMPEQSRIWIYVVILSVFCTGISFIVQSIAQQYTEASHVGVIYALELVFAGLVAWIFAGEVLLPRNYIGAGLLFLSLLISVTGSRETSEDQELEEV